MNLLGRPINPRLGIALRSALVGLACAVASGSAGAQESFPSKTVRIVVPYGPGGVGDLTMRLLAQKLGETTGQQWIIDNRPGAGGRLAMRTVLDAPSDGYTLGVTGNGQAISMSLFKNRPYDVLNDFTQVSIVASFEVLLVVRKDSPFKTMRDLVEQTRRNPGKLNFGTVLPGSTQNLSAHLLLQLENLKATIVPFKTTPDLVTAVLRRDVDVGFDFYAGLTSGIRGGDLRVLASAGATRSELTPDVPTAIESGFPQYVVTSWNALAAPKGLPDGVLKVLNKQVMKALADPSVKSKAAAIGLHAEGSTPEQMHDRMASDIKKWATVIEKAGIPKQ
jgi:tripartite-type tricarboxylate transporter receptor subunit TctC